jgi:hypothetical protein
VLNIPQFPNTLPISQMTDILDDSYESDLTEEEHERLILMSEHAIAKPLSSAAQAVLDAFLKAPIQRTHIEDDQYAIAAALRAAADQVVPPNGSRKNNEIRSELLAIAAELETSTTENR